MCTRKVAIATTIVVLGIVLFSAGQANADQPYLGFDGTLVDLPRGSGIPPQIKVKGMRVDRVKRRTPAARMGLERGDIIVTIDNYGFTSFDGYLAAIRRSWQRPSILIINVRNGKLQLTPTGMSCDHTANDVNPTLRKAESISRSM